MMRAVDLSRERDGSQYADALRRAVFSSLYELGCHVPKWIFVLATVFDFFQLLVLPLSPKPYFPWRSMKILRDFYRFMLSIVLIPGTSFEDWSTPGAGMEQLFVASAVWVVLTVSLFLWSMLHHAGLVDYFPNWARILLRWSTWGGLHAFWVPLCSSLLSPFRCSKGATWGVTDVVCYDSTHLGTFIGAIVLLPLFLAYTAGVTLLGISRNPKWLTCVPITGRPFVLLLLARLVMIAAYMLAPVETTSGYLHAAVSIAGGAVWTGVYAWLLPYRTPWLNSFCSSLAFIFTTTAFVAVAALALDQATCHVGAIAFYMCAPLAGFMGYVLPLLRFRMLGDSAELSSPTLVFLRSAYCLAEERRLGSNKFLRSYSSKTAGGAAGDATGGGGGGSGYGGGVSDAMSVVSGGTRHTGAGNGEAEAITVDHTDSGSQARMTLASANGGDDDRLTARSGGSSARSGATGHTGGTAYSTASVLDMGARASQGKVEAAARLSPAQRMCDALWAEATSLFASSALVQLLCAWYFAHERGNDHLERVHLRQAGALAPPLDIAFFLWQRESELDIAEKSGGTSRRGHGGSAGPGLTTVQLRVEFEGGLAQARALSHRLRVATHDFWSCLCDAAPDLARLQATGKRITSLTSEADAAYRALVALCPQSASLLRAFAELLLETQSAGEAHELLEQAEALEDEQSRSASASHEADVLFGRPCARGELDLSTDSLALLTVSSRGEDCGAITSANAAALRMLGYARRELVGRPVDAVIPAPIAGVHPALVQRFLRTGVEVVVGTSRVLFFLARSGHVLPTRASIHASGSDAWVCAAEEVRSGLSFLFFLDSSAGWRVQAACPRAAALLAIDLAAMRSGAVSLSSHVSDIPNVVATLRGRDAAVITLRNVANARGEKGFGATAVVTAKLQAVRVPFLGSTLYILRFRAATDSDRQTAAAIARIDGEVQESSSSAGDQSPRGLNEAAQLVGGEASGLDGSGASSGLGGSVAEGGGSFVLGSADSGRAGLRAAPHTHPPPRKRVAFAGGAGTTTAFGSSGRSHGSHASSGSDTQPPNHHLRLHHRHLPGSPPPPPSEAPLPGASTPDVSDGNATAENDRGVRRHGDASESTDGSDDGGEATPTGAATAPLPQSFASSVSPTTLRRRTRGSAVGRASPDTLHIVSAAEDSDDYEKEGREKRQSHDREDATRAHRGGGWTHGADSNGEHTNTTSAKGREFTVAVRQAGAAGGSPEAASHHYHHKAGSVRSGNSGGSGKSSASLHDTLRRGLSVRSSRPDASLVRLNRAVIVTSLLMACLFLFSAVQSSSTFGQLVRNFARVNVAGVASLNLQFSFGIVQQLVMANAGSINASDTAVGALKAQLWSMLGKIETAHQAMYLAVDGTVPAEMALYTDSNAVTVFDLVPGSYVNRWNYSSTPRNSSLGLLGQEFVSTARQLYYRPLSGFVDSDPAVFFVQFNGFQFVRDAFNASLIFTDARSGNQADAVSNANFVVLVLALCLIGATSLAFIVPSMLRVAAARRAVFILFLQVPLPVLQALRAVVTERVQAAERAMEEEEDAGGGGIGIGMDDAGVAVTTDSAAAGGTEFPGGEPSDAASQLAQTLNTLKNKHRRDTSTSSRQGPAESATLASRLCGAMCARRCLRRVSDAPPERELHGNKPRSGRQREYAHSSGERSKLLAWALAPMLLFCGYIVGQWVWHEQMATYARYARSEVLWSRQLACLTPQLASGMRRMLFYTEPGLVNWAIPRAYRQIDFYNYLTSALAFGDAGRMLRPGLQASPSVFDMFMRDGCVPNDGYYTLQECRQGFQNGLVTDGLLATARAYTAGAKVVIDARKAQLAATPPRGSLPPVSVETGLPFVVNQLGLRFLAAGMIAAADARIAETIGTLEAFAQQDVLVASVAIAALLLLYVGVYRRLIASLDADIKSCRSLLLLFPDEVTRAVPELGAYARGLLKSAGGGGGGVAQSRSHQQDAGRGDASASGATMLDSGRLLNSGRPD